MEPVWSLAGWNLELEALLPLGEMTALAEPSAGKTQIYRIEVRPRDEPDPLGRRIAKTMVRLWPRAASPRKWWYGMMRPPSIGG